MCGVSLAIYAFSSLVVNANDPWARVLFSFVFGCVALGCTIWVIDAWVLMSGTGRSPHRRDHDSSIKPDRNTGLALEEEVRNLRLRELQVSERYDAACGSLEDVLRARGARLKAEIDLLRQTSTKNQ